MELASLLAGERWSDHPSCTHPLLAQLAQRVNDHTSDEGRQRLVPLIPPVVGRRGDDHTWLTVAVAVAASPVYDVPEAHTTFTRRCAPTMVHGAVAGIVASQSPDRDDRLRPPRGGHRRLPGGDSGGHCTARTGTASVAPDPAPLSLG